MKKPAVQLNILEAIKRRDEGLSKAIQNAENEDAGWADRAYAYFIKWMFLLEKGKEFLMEDFREWAAMNGLPNPPSARAFGGIPQRASADRLIEKAGFGKTKNIKAHNTPATLWRKI